MKPSRKMLIPIQRIRIIPIISVSWTLTLEVGIYNRVRRTFANRRGESDDAVDRGFTVQTADKIGEVVEDGEIVLDGDDIAPGVEETADYSSSLETLFDVEVTRGLVEHVPASRSSVQ